MYAVRVYKDYNTNKIDMIRIVNSDTLQFKDYNVKELKTILKYDKSAIKNLALDMYGNIKLIGGNPTKKVNYYKEVYQGKYKIRLYCIIIGYNQSVLNFIADTYNDNIIRGSDATIGEIIWAAHATEAFQEFSLIFSCIFVFISLTLSKLFFTTISPPDFIISLLLFSVTKYISFPYIFSIFEYLQSRVCFLL